VFLELPARPPGSRLVNVVIDTPKGSRNKYKYDPDLGCFRLSRILPGGAVFPWNFGFIPSTRAEDGDALDVLVIMDDAMPVGMVAQVQLLGVLTASQTQNRRTIRNDRLVGVPVTEVNPPRLRSLKQLGPNALRELEHFFVSYNLAQGRVFRPRGRLGPKAAAQMLAAALVR
jgi:inorganic pyrophosphatase